MPLEGRGRGAHLVDGHAVVEEPGHELRKRGGGQGGSDLMAHVAGVVEVVRCRQHVREQRVERRGLGVVVVHLKSREGILGRDGRKYGSVAVECARKVVGEHVHRLMRTVAERFGVEGCFEGVVAVRTSHGARAAASHGRLRASSASL